MPAPEGKRLPASFSDVTTDATTFVSNWRSTKNVMDAETSTEPIKVSGRRTQHPEMAEQSMQTGEAATAAPGAGFAHSQLLDAFLLEATPLLEDQLARNFEENKFAQYEVSWEEEHDQVTCAHAFKHEGKLAAHAPDACTAVAWNASGSVVAAAYGALDRADWPAGCESMLCTWSVWRRQLDPKRADVALPLADCLTCLAYHPEDPSVLAGGAYNGEVLLWNFAADGDDALWGKSVMSGYSHHEPVLQLAWTKAPPGGGGGHLGYIVVSVGGDGKVLCWEPSAMALPAQGFRVGGRAAGQPAPPAGSGGGLIAGGCALGFSAADPSTFVVGLEHGEVLKCGLGANELRSAEAVRRQHSDVPWSHGAAALLARVPAAQFPRLKQKIDRQAVLKREREVGPALVYDAKPEMEHLYGSPTTFELEKHSGPVFAVAFSPFHRHLLLTASSDGSARLYNVLQQRPVLTLEPSTSSLFAACWSPSRPTVFAVGGADGNLYVYDVGKSRGLPEATLQVTTNKSPLYSIMFNPQSPQLVATADAQGYVKVWRLSHALNTMGPRDKRALDRLAEAKAADAGDGGDGGGGDGGGGDEDDYGDDFGDDDFE